MLLAIAGSNVWQNFTLKGTDSKLKAPENLLTLIVGKILVYIYTLPLYTRVHVYPYVYAESATDRPILQTS